jgi:hypothetical protein
MALRKHRKHNKDMKLKHKALNVRLAGFIMLILIIMAGIFYYVKYMPQVSNRAADEALIEYHGALQGLYPELNENYARLKQDGDEEKWDEFSRSRGSKDPSGRKYADLEGIGTQSRSP